MHRWLVARLPSDHILAIGRNVQTKDVVAVESSVEPF